MYIESKATGLSGDARIGRVSFSQTGKMLYYGGKRFERLRGGGFKSNYFDSDSGEPYWISGCKKRGGDLLYPGPDRSRRRRARGILVHHPRRTGV